MKLNAFDKGYQIIYERDGCARLVLPGSLPLIELNRERVASAAWYQKPQNRWFIREMTMTDAPIDELLPENWRTMKYRGFATIAEFREWVQFS